MFKNICAIVILFTLIACGEEKAEVATTKLESTVAADTSAIEEVNPKELLKDAYQQFKEGNDEESIRIANEVLTIGRETKNDTLIGGALSSLCRNAQRTLDTTRLGELSVQLAELAESSGDQIWMMKRAHMNAEMWRLVGNMDRAEAFYDESMRISLELEQMGMYTIDHFNKSFVCTAKGDFIAARTLITKYYALQTERNPEAEDAYGLIALAYILEQEKNYKDAHEVAVVTRRLFEEQNIFPEPPDEKPLLMVEVKVKEELSEDIYTITAKNSTNQSVSSLVDKHLK